MDIAFIINHEDGRTANNNATSPETDNPGHFYSPPTTPKDHCYYTTAVPGPAAIGSTSPGTPAHFRFQLGYGRKPRCSSSSENFESDDDHSTSPILPRVSQMPLKKRPLRTRDDERDETLRPAYVAIRLLANDDRNGPPKRTLRAAATPPLSKKARTDAAVTYDSIDIDLSEADVFSPDWAPSLAVFDDRPPPSIRWKGTSLDIERLPYYDRLHPTEVTIASTLRLMPEQYIRCKRVLVLAAQAAQNKKLPFRKSEAQKLCRIDVNKVSVLWTVFGNLGWLGTCWPGRGHRHRR